MKFMVCPICKSNKNSNFRCEYKLEIHEDKKYFGDLKIDKCNNCDFSSYSFDRDMDFRENHRTDITRSNLSYI